MNPSIRRIFKLHGLLEKKSHFLFGPRQTGKTYLIHKEMSDTRLYDLVDASVFVH